MLKFLYDLCEEAKQLWKEKCFAIGILVTMLLSYGTLLIHPTVGIDDTAFKVYFVDGVAPAMGRWCLYIINKIIPLSYNPYFMELIGMISLFFSVTLWCVLLKKLFRDTIPYWGYTIFGCVILSSPILSEVVVYYLHNGIFTGYGITALAVMALLESVTVNEKNMAKRQIIFLILAVMFLTIAIGLYESFIIVFMVAVLMVYFVIRLLKIESYQVNMLGWSIKTVGILVGTMAFRTWIIKIIVSFFHLESQKEVLNYRGLYEFWGWFDGTRNIEEFIFVLKDFFVKYYLNAIVYVPIMIFVLAIGFIVIGSIIWGWKRRDGWIVAVAFGILFVPWIMPILEGSTTFYRSSQYIPIVSGFAVLLFVWSLNKIKCKLINRVLPIMILTILLYNQTYEMAKWLYLDSMKYEDTKQVLEEVSIYIRSNCDSQKPICIVGQYQVPDVYLQEGITPVWSKKYTIISNLVKGLDENLSKKYITDQGYVYYETLGLSFVRWGATAFYGFDREIIKFWKMHGIELTEDGNLEHYEYAREQMENIPSWPEQGSIIEMEDYIIVNFG